MDELTPCPFCGNPAKLIKTGHYFYCRCSENSILHTVESDLEDTPEDAIKTWNARPIEDRFYTAERDALVEACQLSARMFESLRMDFGVGDILTPAARDLYKTIEEHLAAALAKARGE